MQEIIKAVILGIFKVIEKGGRIFQIAITVGLLLATALAFYSTVRLTPVLQGLGDLGSRVTSVEAVAKSNASNCKELKEEHTEDMGVIEDSLDKHTMMLGRICGALGIYCE